MLKEIEKQPGKSCHIAGKVQATEAELRALLIDVNHLHGYGLTVKVNGHSSRLLLDTGASGILINSGLAQKAGITPLATTKLAGIGDKGPVDGYIGYANSIRIGELEFRDCLVEVSNKRSVLEDDGLIGADVFSHFLVTIDFLWQKLKLTELPKVPGRKEETATLELEDEGEGPADTSTSEAKAGTGDSGPYDRYVAPEMQGYTQVWRFGHNLLIPTWVSDVGPKFFLIDTGAVINSISPEAAKEVTKTHHDAFTSIQGISGAVKNVYSADKAVLKFSHYVQENQDLAAFDLSGISAATGTEVSGILGFVTLRQFILTIDYRDGLVDLKYTGPKKR
jgi:predicted aspartyl protease